jgi:predicted nucleic acid-binding protein
MNARTFLDTNIFIYSFDQSSPLKARRAVSIIREAIDRRKGVVSFQVVQEFFNVALRRFTTPMTTAEAAQYLATTFQPLFSVQSSERLYHRALQTINTHRLSWYDSLIVAAALESDSEVLLTEDLQDGQKFGSLVVRNPFI